MLDFLRNLLAGDAFAPHGMCLLWRPELIWTHVVADSVIGLAYFSIPLVLASFVSRRQDVAFGWVFWSFAVFILACGTGHFFSIWTLWNPDYGAEALIKLVTAGASIATAVALWPLLPKALALPSPAQLRQANLALEARIAERDAALAALARESEERRRAEDMLRQAQKMEAVGQLTGGVAHDFNNLLTIIIASLERIERRTAETGADPVITQAAARALAGAERAALVTQQLLAFARKQPLQPAELDPSALISNLAPLLERSGEPRTSIALRFAREAVTVTVDRNQMEAALLNLAVNARDAMPDGGTLTLATRILPAREAAGVPGLARADHLVIEVSDTGTGMPPEVAERAFDPFFTTKGVGQGTGLGLSQVYGFVKQSGGHSELESDLGHGTTVRLYLPCVMSQAVREHEPTLSVA